MSAPTIAYMDSFDHQALSTNGFGSSYDSLYTLITGTPTFVTGRDGIGQAIRFPNSANHSIDTRRTGTIGHFVFSGYFRVSGIPTANVLLNDCGIGSSGNGIFCNTEGYCQASLHSNGQDGGSIYIADNAWHRVDWYVNSTQNPWWMWWQVDGVPQLPIYGSTAAVTSGESQLRMGHGATHGSVNTDWDSYIMSYSPGDYPIGPHRIIWLVPNADEVHQAGTNVIEDESGNDIHATNFPAWSRLDEWPANTTDYVRQFATGSNNWATVRFEDIATTENVLGVQAVGAMISDNTTANHGIVSVMNAAGDNVATLYNGDMSETALHYRRAMVPLFDAGRGTPTMVNNLLMKMGFSTNVASQPRWTALGLQVAVSDTQPRTPSISVGGPGRP